jgi:hypothetical protein
MTTILVTRDFMITDCRVTSLRHNEKTYFDNKCKIETDCTVVHKGKRIVAMAACGDVSSSSYVKSLMSHSDLAGFELETLTKILNGMPVHRNHQSDYEIVCLLEDGECVIVSGDVKHNGITVSGIGGTTTRTYLIKTKHCLDGNSSVVFGSGNAIFNILKDRINTSELSFVDVFYFAAGLDSSSSNSYSTYSRVTNELFVTVNPTKKDITERMNRVLKKINFTDPEYKKKNSVNS